MTHLTGGDRRRRACRERRAAHRRALRRRHAGHLGRPHLARGGRRRTARDPPGRRRGRDRRRGEPPARRAERRRDRFAALDAAPSASRATRPASSRSTRAWSARPRPGRASGREVTAARVSCSEYSFPAVSGQDARIGIVKLLGFELVDLALFLPRRGGARRRSGRGGGGARCLARAPRPGERGPVPLDRRHRRGDRAQPARPRAARSEAGASSPPPPGSPPSSGSRADDPARRQLGRGRGHIVDRLRRGARLAGRGGRPGSASRSGSRPTQARSLRCPSSRTGSAPRFPACS